LLGSEELVAGVLRDLDSSSLGDKEKALLRFVDKVNHASTQISIEDMRPLYAAGWDDEAIFYSITVCALFNFYNRWVDATGVHAMGEEAHKEGGRRTALHGYMRT
jgi:alkylhydroperoxidase family enzyme